MRFIITHLLVTLVQILRKLKLTITNFTGMECTCNFGNKFMMRIRSRSPKVFDTIFQTISDLI